MWLIGDRRGALAIDVPAPMVGAIRSGAMWPRQRHARYMWQSAPRLALLRAILHHICGKSLVQIALEATPASVNAER
jgi:hypothetical protein